MKWVVDFVSSNKILALILFISLALRFIGLIPNISNNDEGYILKHSKELFYNIVSKGDFDPHAYKYGSLIFYLQALVYIPIYLIGLFLVGVGLSSPPPKLGVPLLDFVEHVSSNFDVFLLWEGRAVIALFGTFSVLLVYLLVKHLYGHNYGPLSALILAVNPFHVRDSHYATTDVLLLFFILLSLFFMVLASKTSKLKWYLVGGLVVGIASTIKYFPLALLALPIAFLMDKKKNKQWLAKIFLTVLVIPLGVFIGIPFLFLHPENKVLLEREVGAQFLWYGTSITAYLSSLVEYFISFGKSEILPLSTLVPSEFTEFHSAFLVFKVFGPILVFVSLIGMLVGFIKFPLKTLFLSVIPIFTFIYISFYVPAVFERLSLPVVPFISIFGSIFFIELWGLIVKSRNRIVPKIFFILIFMLALFYPLKTALASSWSCGRDVNSESKKWIEENVSADKKVAQVSPVYMPEDFSNVKELRPDSEFFVNEVQDLGVNYFLINTGLFTRFLYQFENDFFVIPEKLYMNYYVPLALREYELRSDRSAIFERHEMCDLGNFVFYKIPEKLPEQKRLLVRYDFNEQDRVKEMLLENLEGGQDDVFVRFSESEGHAGRGSLEYGWNRLYYRGPRAMFPQISIEGGKIYTFSVWVKSKEKLSSGQRDAFLRIDFNNGTVDQNGFGQYLALSSRIYGEPHWQKVSVTVKSPQGAKFAVLSLQAIGTLNVNSFYFDDLGIFSEP